MRRAISVGAALALAACGLDHLVSSPSGVTLALAADTTLVVGESRALRIRAGDSSAPDGIRVRWQSSDSSVVRPDSAGVLHGVREGSASVTALVSAPELPPEGVSVSRTLVVAYAGIAIDAMDSLTSIGQVVSPVVRGLDVASHPDAQVPATLTSDDPTIVSVSGATITAQRNGNVNLVATYGELTAHSNVKVHQVARRVAFKVQPTSASPGVAIAPPIQVAVADSLGVVVPDATSVVTLAIASNPGAGVLGGTAALAASAGVATFSSLSVSASGTGYTLAASSAGLTGATSAPFDVYPFGPATKLRITVQPTTVKAGVVITPAFQVCVSDASSNTVTIATDVVTVSFGANPGGATLGGTVSVAAVSGCATFSNLTINIAASGYRLSASATGLTGVTSNNFNVNP